MCTETEKLIFKQTATCRNPPIVFEGVFHPWVLRWALDLMEWAVAAEIYIQLPGGDYHFLNHSQSISQAALPSEGYQHNMKVPQVSYHNCQDDAPSRPRDIIITAVPVSNLRFPTESLCIGSEWRNSTCLSSKRRVARIKSTALLLKFGPGEVHGLMRWIWWHQRLMPRHLNKWCESVALQAPLQSIHIYIQVQDLPLFQTEPLVFKSMPQPCCDINFCCFTEHSVAPFSERQTSHNIAGLWPLWGNDCSHCHPSRNGMVYVEILIKWRFDARSQQIWGDPGLFCDGRHCV